MATFACDEDENEALVKHVAVEGESDEFVVRVLIHLSGGSDFILKLNIQEALHLEDLLHEAARIAGDESIPQNATEFFYG